MSDRQRRSSLLDQMAMAAAQIEADDFEDEDEEDEVDEEEGLVVIADSGIGVDSIDEEGEEEDEEFLERMYGGASDDPAVDEIVAADDSEESDEFENLAYQPIGMEYQWEPGMERPADEPVEKEYEVPSIVDYGYETVHVEPRSNTDGTIRRTSYGKLNSRRTSHAESEGSHNSAPARAGNDSEFMTMGQERRRPSSISVPADDVKEPARRHSSIRRTSFQIRNPLNPTSYDDDALSNVSSNSPGGGLLGGVRSRKRRSTRRQNLSMAMHNRVGSGSRGDLDAAMEVFKKQDSNSQWENVAAAAAVVAASATAGGSNKRHIQFATNETVLVFLTLLNVTNMDDPKDCFTVAPVNKFGFPAGEGRTEEEKAGPYSFVLATVKTVHFDEDDRYYTVIRADTGSEQRADSSKYYSVWEMSREGQRGTHNFLDWMERVRDPAGIDAALRAAKKTVRSTQDTEEEIVEEKGLFQTTAGFLLWPVYFFRDTVVPMYKRQRANAKHYATKMLYGDSPFACRIRITGINFLVFCSLVFLLLETINLAFIPPEWDYVVTICGVVIWSILVLELVFETLIRPSNYFALMQSDKAFAPSAARHINSFHLLFETLALLTFLPEVDCLSERSECTREGPFSRVGASLDSVVGDTTAAAARGRFVLGMTVLRLFGLVRHWKQMWINNTFRPVKREGIVEKILFRRETSLKNVTKNRKKKDDETESSQRQLSISSGQKTKEASEEDERLKNAATIGTALMVVNSQRALLLLASIVIVLPVIGTLTGQNDLAPQYVDLLQANNIAAANDCVFLQESINSWLSTAATSQRFYASRLTEDSYVLWAQLLPVRCDFQRADGVITFCDDELSMAAPDTCAVWDSTLTGSDNGVVNARSLGSELGLRPDGIREEIGLPMHVEYKVSVFYNENPTIAITNLGVLCLIIGILILSMIGLQALRGDARRLVLDPLQRMLKIVLRYAENPLASKDETRLPSETEDRSANGDKDDADEIGNYETEQLISAIAKIADLLRKCWGVAGAGIISSNLARTKDGKTVVFNPTVPGKRVYALFGFVSINGFSDQLRALDRDVMILINDVAKVVHDEVYRWALGDSGQCNKNLGASFLMVFRIGDSIEVHAKKEKATAVVFNSNRTKSTVKRVSSLRRRGGSRPAMNARNRGASGDKDTLQLASLPGIQSFADRALLGMLKSFAGLHRDKNLNVWKHDFRLSAGVSAYSVEVIYGMDAGWAVEGAVGSEYKIDATYLSPHVNMASRMMSASKQYGVTILLSKAVEEILSRSCRRKLRHLDTVYVKGSKVKQAIYTYDARHHGVDFFLIERTPDQADKDAEAYTPNIWDTDQDLRAMNQHVSDDFNETYSLALKQYLSGKWMTAYENFDKANKMMIQTVVEDGYVDYDIGEFEQELLDWSNTSEDVVRIRNDIGDGACRVLMSYIERRGFTPPASWDAVRPLLSK